MRAQELYLDTIANNLANVNTNGYKRARVDFEDLLYQTINSPTQANGATPGRSVGLQVGHGSRAVDTERIYVQGDTDTTNNPLDLVIQGDGFFQVMLPDGTTGYSRDGSLKLDSDGRVVTAQGYVVQPEITLPNDTTSIAVTADGKVSVEQASTTGSNQVGQLQLARFPNPGGLVAQGGNILKQSPATGDPQVGNPGESGIGTLIQGALERSNVDVVEEMVNMVVAQRAFEMNSKAIKTADDMMQVASNLQSS